MKVKTSKKSVKNAFHKIHSIGYCNIQYLTNFVNPFAYSTGVYGWACDYYNIEGVCLSTGYGPIGECVNYDLIKKYENKAQKICLDYKLDYQVRKKKVSKLLIKFISEINNQKI